METSSVNRVFFLGTGAADWPVCDKVAYDKGTELSTQGGGNTVPLSCVDNPVPLSHTLDSGRYFRRNSSVLFNDCILLDCGPSVPEALDTFHQDSSKIKDILITHSHPDHLSIETLNYLVKRRPECGPLNVWGHKEVLDRISCVEGLCLMPVNTGDIIHVSKGRGCQQKGTSPEGTPLCRQPRPLDTCVDIQVLEANHMVSDSQEVAFHYLFSHGERQWLYATDGAWLLHSAWKALEQSRLDMIVWDATIGDVEGDYRIFEHNSLAMIRLMYATLKKQGIIRDETRIVLTHMARTLHDCHDEMEKKLSREGLIVAYDGMCIKL